MATDDTLGDDRKAISPATPSRSSWNRLSTLDSHRYRALSSLWLLVNPADPWRFLRDILHRLVSRYGGMTECLSGGQGAVILAALYELQSPVP